MEINTAPLVKLQTSFRVPVDAVRASSKDKFPKIPGMYYWRSMLIKRARTKWRIGAREDRGLKIADKKIA
jgi:hypothetical protein